MNNSPYFSIIVNCYNSSHYLKNSLDSALSQTFKDFELIFWDNCSTDNSKNIFKDYVDDRFKYFLSREHTNLGEARNLAVSVASGKWLCFLDCDDMIYPDKLELQFRALQEAGNDVALVYGKTHFEIEKSGRVKYVGKRLEQFQKNKAHKPLPEGKILNKLLLSNFVPLISIAVRRDVYIALGGINPSLKHAEDYDLILKVARRYNVLAIQSEICMYRVHSSNITHGALFDMYIESLIVIWQCAPSLNVLWGVIYQTLAFMVGFIRRHFLIK